MNILSEEKYFLIKRYVDLLEMIEEAFFQILSCFDKFLYAQADELLNDVFLAFTQIDDSNIILIEHFTESPAVIKDFNKFAVIIEKVEYLFNLIIEQEGKEKIVREDLYPAFRSWKLQICNELKQFYLF